MNDPEPKHSQLCQCDKCRDFTPALVLLLILIGCCWWLLQVTR